MVGLFFKIFLFYIFFEKSILSFFYSVYLGAVFEKSSVIPFESWLGLGFEIGHRIYESFGFIWYTLTSI